jgi:hypothetical protein
MMRVSARHAGGPFSRFLRAAVLAGRIALCLLGFTFIAWWIAVPILGGDALSGCIEHGHYYLALKGGCRARTEVSRAVFEYSRWHTYLMLAMWVIGMLAFLLNAMIRLIRFARQWRSRRGYPDR